MSIAAVSHFSDLTATGLTSACSIVSSGPPPGKDKLSQNQLLQGQKNTWKLVTMILMSLSDVRSQI
jgi:hypothetical protein